MAERDRGSVLVELTRIGAVVKVTAIDPETLTEVSIMGPASAGEETLKRNAVRKLEYVLAQKAGRRG
ncbi:MAG TPA: hypothetical protein VJN41_06985 [Alphaproteobacteria bacterium]|nr:hypothetical protein [Alphaproteobacteria bacterium]